MTFMNWLLLLFITLKLTGYITWSWFFVLAPITIPMVLIAFGMLWKFIENRLD